MYEPEQILSLTIEKMQIFLIEHFALLLMWSV